MVNLPNLRCPNCWRFRIQPISDLLNLVDVSDIFNFFLLREGEGGVRGVRKGGGRFLLKIPGGGGGVFRRGGAEGPGGCLRRIGIFLGGGPKYFFFGPETSTKFQGRKNSININFLVRISRGHS